MKDQFDELTVPKALREECRSLYAQLQMTQKASARAYVRALDELLAHFSDEELLVEKPSLDDLQWYVEKKKQEMAND
jgi:predicted HAD superfamily phosphohydrolase